MSATIKRQRPKQKRSNPTSSPSYATTVSIAVENLINMIAIFAVSGTVLLGLLDDRFHETGIENASIYGTGSMLVDSSFEKS
jgi:hypothetical protein